MTSWASVTTALWQAPDARFARSATIVTVVAVSAVIIAAGAASGTT
jgi:hypothetical protein